MFREKLLNDIVAQVLICKRCALWKNRKNAVPGEGNAQAKIMLVGEAPGSSEDTLGKPFVGAAGKFLETLLSKTGFSRAEVFICNVVKCRPPRNRNPKPEEVQTCVPYLDRQTKIIKPPFVVTLGNCSTAYFFSKAHLSFANITTVHGKIQKVAWYGTKMTIFPTFHPAAALYSARYRDQITVDFELLRKELKKKEAV